MATTDIDDCKGTLGLENDKFALNCEGKVVVRVSDDCPPTARDPQGNLVERKESGVVDAASSATPLGADGVFTSPWIDTAGYINLSVVVFTDQDSAIDGLQVQLSSDGVNVDATDEFIVKPNVGEQFTFGLTTKFVRIKYTNGPVAQSVFRLQSSLFINGPKPSTHRIDDAIDGENDAELVKSVSTAKDVNGMFVNLPAGSVINSNSSTSLLTSGSTFTGSFVDQTGYGGTTVFVHSDQNGELFVDSSADGVNFISETFEVSGYEFFKPVHF